MIFMFMAIYFLVLGILMGIILSCSIFGFFYREIEAWKVKSLMWMTFYYFTCGLAYIYVIKGTIYFFEYDHDEFLFGNHSVSHFIGFSK